MIKALAPFAREEPKVLKPVKNPFDEKAEEISANVLNIDFTLLELFSSSSKTFVLDDKPLNIFIFENIFIALNKSLSVD